MVKVNGKERDVSGKTVGELLAIENQKPAQVAVELNLEILPRDAYDSTVLRDGDAVEIVMFMGGGAAKCMKG